MKTPTPKFLAALLLAGAAPFAYSQPLPAGLVDEPVASVSRSDAVADAIAQALNADASMKHSKVTVQPDENGIFLSGTTLTDAQSRQAIKIATSHAGQGKVSSGILSNEIVLWSPPPQEVDNGLAEPAVAETEAVPAK